MSWIRSRIEHWIETCTHNQKESVSFVRYVPIVFERVETCPMTVLISDPKLVCATPSFRRGLSTQVRVVNALMRRDALSRFGHHNLGFFWIFGEPLILMCLVSILWSIVHTTHDDNVQVVPFALTGYSFLTIWRHVVSRSIGSLRTAVSLQYHRSVRLIDVVIARALIECLGVFSAFIFAYLSLACLGFCPLLRDPLNLVIGFVLISWFSFALGLVLASLSELGHALHHLIPPLMYVTLPLTGVFTMQAWLPASIRDVLSWSPLVNIIELIRSGVFSEEAGAIYSIPYVLVWCSLLTVVGVALYRFSESRTEAE